MEERAAHIRRVKPQTKANRSWIHGIYRKHKVKKKKIVAEKQASAASLAEDNAKLINIVPALENY